MFWNRARNIYLLEFSSGIIGGDTNNSSTQLQIFMLLSFINSYADVVFFIDIKYKTIKAKDSKNSKI
jgi:hypothetical protein